MTFSRVQFFLIPLLCLFLTGCILRPYKFEIEQGNVITTDKIAQIQPGMSEEEVSALLGTPLLTDVFHGQRWDYVYYDKPGYKPAVERHVAIYFTHGRVDRIKADPLSSEGA